MRAPPEAQTRSPAAANGRAKSQDGKSTTDFTPEPIDFQALKLSDLYSFQEATPYTIAQLVWGAAG